MKNFTRSKFGASVYRFHLRVTPYCEKNPILAGHVAQKIVPYYSSNCWVALAKIVTHGNMVHRIGTIPALFQATPSIFKVGAVQRSHRQLHFSFRYYTHLGLSVTQCGRKNHQTQRL